jgi:hypothetical protein
MSCPTISGCPPPVDLFVNAVQTNGYSAHSPEHDRFIRRLCHVSQAATDRTWSQEQRRRSPCCEACPDRPWQQIELSDTRSDAGQRGIGERITDILVRIAGDSSQRRTSLCGTPPDREGRRTTPLPYCQICNGPYCERCTRAECPAPPNIFGEEHAARFEAPDGVSPAVSSASPWTTTSSS